MRICGYNRTCLGVKIPGKTVYQKQTKNICPPFYELFKTRENICESPVNAYSFHTMSPLNHLSFILGYNTNRPLLSWGSPQYVVKLKKWTMISRLAAIEYRSPRDQFDTSLTFINT